MKQLLTRNSSLHLGRKNNLTIYPLHIIYIWRRGKGTRQKISVSIIWFISEEWRQVWLEVRTNTSLLAPNYNHRTITHHIKPRGKSTCVWYRSYCSLSEILTKGRCQTNFWISIYYLLLKIKEVICNFHILYRLFYLFCRISTFGRKKLTEYFSCMSEDCNTFWSSIPEFHHRDDASDVLYQEKEHLLPEEGKYSIIQYHLKMVNFFFFSFGRNHLKEILNASNYPDQSTIIAYEYAKIANHNATFFTNFNTQITSKWNHHTQ